MYTIRKLFKFETAHVLNTSYSQECQKIHGHSYQLEIIITNKELNKDGMVIDFKKLKEIINSEIINKFDHTFVMSRNQLNSNALKLVTNGLVLVDYNPTAENMCKDFYHKIKPLLLNKIKSLINLKVRLHETDTGWAEYSEYLFG